MSTFQSFQTGLMAGQQQAKVRREVQSAQHAEGQRQHHEVRVHGRAGGEVELVLPVSEAREADERPSGLG